MVSARHLLGTSFGLAALALAGAGLAFAETPSIGVITRLDGTATLARRTLPPGTPLKFRDPVFVADRISTGDQSLARILFGGKALVTVRERSVLTVTEARGTSTVHVGVGKIGIAVVKELVQPGERVDIRTPNAVATIRGTVVIAEVSPDADGGEGDVTTTLTVLKGVVELKQLDTLTRQPVGPMVTLRAVESIRVTGRAASLPSPQRLSPQAAQRLVNGLKVGVKAVPVVNVAGTTLATPSASGPGTPSFIPPGAPGSKTSPPTVSGPSKGRGVVATLATNQVKGGRK